MKAMIIATLFAIAGGAHAADTLPPVRIAFDRFIAAFNAGEQEKVEEFARRHAPQSMIGSGFVRQTLDMIAEMGTLEVLDVNATGSWHLEAVVRGREFGDVQLLTITVNSEPPHLLDSIFVEGDGVPPRYRPVRGTEAEAVAAWRDYLEARTRADTFSGAVLLSDGRRVVLREAFGFADRERRIRNSVDTRFRSASVTKMFTAVVVMRLVQERKISLDDPLGRHVPELAAEPLGQGTVRQYLSHTAGAGDLFDDRYIGHQRELRTHDDYLRVFGRDLLKSMPGEEYAYSNLGYMLLGSLIERVTRGSYDDAVQKWVFTPAQMSRTGTRSEDEEVEGRAVPYDRAPGSRKLVSDPSKIDYRPFAACGAYTTVDDLAAFFTALRANRLLNREFTALLLTPTDQTRLDLAHGLGLEFRGRGRERWAGHDGSDVGMSAEAWFSPVSDRILVVLSNFDMPAAEHAANYLKQRLPLE